jgi:hypothetical protein
MRPITTLTAMTCVLLSATLADAQVIIYAGQGQTPTIETPNPIATPEPEKPESSTPTVTMAPEMVPVVPSVGVCKCKGSNHGVCFCLQRGIKCGCNPSKGSVWNLTEAGKPIGKTGEYQHPSWNPQPVMMPTTKPVVDLTDAPDAPGYPITRSGGYIRWNVDGVPWRVLDNLQDGQTDATGRWRLSNGRMIEVAQPAKPSGHWETRRVCRNGVCRMVQVWVE